MGDGEDQDAHASVGDTIMLHPADPLIEAGGKVMAHPSELRRGQCLATDLLSKIEDHPLERRVRSELAMKDPIAVAQHQTEAITHPSGDRRLNFGEIHRQVGRCRRHKLAVDAQTPSPKVS